MSEGGIGAKLIGPSPDTWLAPPAAPWRSAIPVPDVENSFYFEALRQGRLRMLRCQGPTCRRWIHYPIAMCPACHTFDPQPEELIGRGCVYSFTVVNREFTPNYPPPYVAALVEMDEQPGLRVLTNIVGCRIKDVKIGLRVLATFVDYESHALVYFVPEKGKNEPV